MQEYVKIPNALHLILLVRVVIRCYAEIYFHKKCREVKESILDSSTSAHCKFLRESWYNHNDGDTDKKDSSYSAALQLSDSLLIFLVFANCSRVIKSQLEKRLLTSSSEKDTPHKEAGKSHMKVRLIHCSSCFLARNMSKCQILRKTPPKSNHKTTKTNSSSSNTCIIITTISQTISH